MPQTKKDSCLLCIMMLLSLSVAHASHTNAVDKDTSEVSLRRNRVNEFFIRTSKNEKAAQDTILTATVTNVGQSRILQGDEEHGLEEEHADDHEDVEHHEGEDGESHGDEEHHDEDEEHDEEEHHDEEHDLFKEENHDEDHEHDEEENHDEDHELDEEEHHDEDHEHDEEEHHDEDHEHDEEEHHEHEDGEDHDHEHSSMNGFEENFKKPWGTVFLYSVLVNLTALTGVILFIPVLLKGTNMMKSINNEAKMNRRIFDIAIPAFAAGALFATAALLILPETLHFITLGVKARLLGDEDIDDGHDSHGDVHKDEIEFEVNYKFGMSVLLGFFLPMFVGLALPSNHYNVSNITSVDNGQDLESMQVLAADTGVLNDTDAAKEETIEISKKPINWKLICSILIGDGFHNFSDGIFIGIAFMICSRRVAIAMVIATVYHELAQELADYFLLTQHAGLKHYQALLLNFISGFTVTIGSLVILAAPLTWDAVGIILGLSGGVYIHIAACECIPRMEHAVMSFKDKTISILCLGLGALPIALVLLNHDHCVGH